MNDKAKIENCTCQLRKKIVINITAILEESECGVPDEVLVNAFDPDITTSPGGKPVLRIRFCPWCRGYIPLAAIVRTTETDESEPKQDWQGDDAPNDEDWRGTSGG